MTSAYTAIRVARPGRMLSPDGAAIERVIEKGAAWLRATFEASGQRRLILGLSGGLDSAVAALWAARAVEPENLLLVAMPYGLLRSSERAASATESLEHARLVADTLPGSELRVLDIAESVDREARVLGVGDSSDEARIAFGNLKARIRAVRLRTLSNLEQGLVLGTENLSEHLLGYFTLGGDEESDLEINTHLFKTEIRAVASSLGVPLPVQQKPPSADLWAGQTDEQELGYSYEEADPVLLDLVFGRPPAGDPGLVRAVRARVEGTAFKRAPKPSLTLPPSPCQFSTDTLEEDDET